MPATYAVNYSVTAVGSINIQASSKEDAIKYVDGMDYERLAELCGAGSVGEVEACDAEETEDDPDDVTDEATLALHGTE